MTKTSQSHPLQIQSVYVPAMHGVHRAGGTIGMTLCPGRKGSSVAGGSWDRDLEADLEVVRVWKPDAVVALLEDHEYASLGIPHFREVVAIAGLPWLFAPIPDGAVPGRAFYDAWAELGPRVEVILREGGRLLIHCRAGLGRTGLLAASLLVDLGMNADVAINSVRAARPNTIETLDQETYVRFHPSLIRR